MVFLTTCDKVNIQSINFCETHSDEAITKPAFKDTNFPQKRECLNAVADFLEVSDLFLVKIPPCFLNERTRGYFYKHVFFGDLQLSERSETRGYFCKN